jgi:hypothetical protein
MSLAIFSAAKKSKDLMPFLLNTGMNFFHIVFAENKYFFAA